MTNVYDRNTLITAVTNGLQPKYLFFWGHTPGKAEQVGKECLSQWYPAVFVVDGVRYATAEHYMMAEKAQLFGDEDVREKIIAAAHPSLAKNLGRAVQGFTQTTWEQHRFDIVVQGNIAKFGQNPTLKTFLLNTVTRILVEASPMDRIWGIGWSENDPQAQNPEQWRGLNLLGFALMNVRARLLTI
ncbi:MAG: NADAR family protein [Chloroflexi bacterium]|nr:NADAR family protein [Chloroflexota bacterium]MBP8057438.1 NADAR family protein [Chloroflexota bacterium]